MSRSTIKYTRKCYHFGKEYLMENYLLLLTYIFINFCWRKYKKKCFACILCNALRSMNCMRTLNYFTDFQDLHFHKMRHLKRCSTTVTLKFTWKCYRVCNKFSFWFYFDWWTSHENSNCHYTLILIRYHKCFISICVDDFISIYRYLHSTFVSMEHIVYSSIVWKWVGIC